MEVSMDFFCWIFVKTFFFILSEMIIMLKGNFRFFVPPSAGTRNYFAQVVFGRIVLSS